MIESRKLLCVPDDIVDPMEVYTEDSVNSKLFTAHRDLRAWHVEQTGINGNLGDPARSHTESEYVVQVIIKRGRQKRGRKSDGCVVLMKVGNATGGKAITITTMLWRNISRAQKRRKCVNETTTYS